MQRESVQSSICKEFGLDYKNIVGTQQERGLGKLMMYNHLNFNKNLTVDALQQMNGLLWNKGKNPFRTEGMKVVSGRIDNPNIHFQAPPAHLVAEEIVKFCDWFNASEKIINMPPTVRAGIAHLYFVIIHPFEDGNGRIARSIAEKALSQSLHQPCLIALSATIEKHRKTYYNALAKTNHTLDITEWLLFFSDLVIEAQQDSIKKAQLVVEESKFFQRFESQLNERQKKCIRRLFVAESDGGFVGGLSSSNYISIVKTSKATANRDLLHLLELGILEKQGDGKNIRYFLKCSKVISSQT